MLVSEIPALREYWYPIAYSSEIVVAPRPFRIFGEDYVAWRPAADQPVRASVDQCPHRAARLSQGWVSDGCLTCPYHGWRFDRTGSCVEIPANEPGLPIPPRARLRSVLVGERYGLVWVCVGTPRADIPVLPEAEDPAYTLIHEMMETWAASAPRIIDNALDAAHLAFVHRNTIGSSASPRLNNLEMEPRTGLNVQYSTTYTTRVSEQQKRNTGITADFTTRTTRAEIPNPLMFRGVMEYPENGLIHVLFKTCTPVDDGHTLFCQWIARNDAPDEEKQQGIIAVDQQVQAEDRALLEGITPEFPIEITTEVHTRSDRMTLEYRKVLAELAAEGTQVRPDREWVRF
jgi:phenylpropionate dioxygenase-like ring-hydroxylating dioxygenase large terminal subunit